MADAVLSEIKGVGKNFEDTLKVLLGRESSKKVIEDVRKNSSIAGFAMNAMDNLPKVTGILGSGIGGFLFGPLMAAEVFQGARNSIKFRKQYGEQLNSLIPDFELNLGMANLVQSYPINIKLSEYYTLNADGSTTLTAKGDALFNSANNVHELIAQQASDIRSIATENLLKSIKDKRTALELELAQSESETGLLSVAARIENSRIKRDINECKIMESFIDSVQARLKDAGKLRMKGVAGNAEKLDPVAVAIEARLEKIYHVISEKLINVYNEHRTHNILGSDVNLLDTSKLSKKQRKQVALAKTNLAKLKVNHDAALNEFNFQLPKEQLNSIFAPYTDNKSLLSISPIWGSVAVEDVNIPGLQFPAGYDLNSVQAAMGLSKDANEVWNYNPIKDSRGKVVYSFSSFFDDFWKLNKDQIINQFDPRLKVGLDNSFGGNTDFAQNVLLYLKSMLRNKILDIVDPGKVIEGRSTYDLAKADSSYGKIAAPNSEIKKQENSDYKFLGSEAKKDMEKFVKALADFKKQIGVDKSITSLSQLSGFASQLPMAFPGDKSDRIEFSDGNKTSLFTTIAANSNKLKEIKEKAESIGVESISKNVENILQEYRLISRQLISVFLNSITSGSTTQISINDKASADLFYKAFFQTNSNLKSSIKDTIVSDYENNTKLSTEEYVNLISLVRKLNLTAPEAEKMIMALSEDLNVRNSVLPAAVFALKSNSQKGQTKEVDFTTKQATQGLAEAIKLLLEQESDNKELMMALLQTLFKDIEGTIQAKNFFAMSQAAQERLQQDFTSLLNVIKQPVSNTQQARALLNTKLASLNYGASGNFAVNVLRFHPGVDQMLQTIAISSVQVSKRALGGENETPGMTNFNSLRAYANEANINLNNLISEFKDFRQTNNKSAIQALQTSESYLTLNKVKAEFENAKVLVNNIKNAMKIVNEDSELLKLYGVRFEELRVLRESETDRLIIDLGRIIKEFDKFNLTLTSTIK